MVERIQLIVASAEDVVLARLRGREFARALGFAPPDAILITTAIAELARNILSYAYDGTLGLRRVEDRHRGDGCVGLAIRAQDKGPGIADVERALLGGYSTSGRLGVGLSGVCRIMDEVTVKSGAGRGTIVTATKWLGAQASR
ncbi:ATP-binding protein [Dokdonella sp.]|uniref:ATP-binding protein n=1 Tax=Dokdonella sp. TaxID=2291710 RepID=UPI0025C05E7C|nr:ATP-binding protein [Dokdonella sp.]